MRNLNADHQPIFTIVIPCYNAARFLDATLASVAAQSCKEWELILVDDGSTDTSVAIARRFAEHETRMQVIQANHGGVSAARNLGIRMARGKYLAFLDADDLWHPDKLSAHLRHLESRPEVGVSFCRAQFMTADGSLTAVRSSGRIHGLRPAHFLYENPTTTTSALVVWREVFEQVGGFDESMSYSEDLEWLVRVRCRSAWEIEGIDDALTFYRASDTGLSSRLEKMQQGWETLVEHIRAYAPDLIAQHYTLARATHLRYLARRTLRLSLPAAVGWDFMRRAIASDWRVLLVQPQRSLPTLAGVFMRHLVARASSAPQQPAA